MADWLTFAAVYLWAGTWASVKLERDGADPFDLNHSIERWMPLVIIMLWPAVLILAAIYAALRGKP